MGRDQQIRRYLRQRDQGKRKKLIQNQAAVGETGFE
jgi:hypothetical protein